MKRKLKNITALILSFVCLACLLSLSAPESKAANYNRDNIFFFLKNNMGLNTAAAVGILTNIQKESSFNPGALGDYNAQTGMYTSYGICQWHNTRWERLKNYCAENGYDWKSLTGQLYYLYYELQNYYPNTFGMIRGVKNNFQGAYDAAYYFCRHFEIPANAEQSAQRRGELAKSTYWPIYGYSGGMKAPKLKLNAEYTSISSRVPFSLSWSKPEGTFDKYKLYIVRCIDETAGYDWDNLIEYTVSSSSKKKTIKEAKLSGGNYLAFIKTFDTKTNKRSDYSNFLYFSVYDELIYKCSKIEKGKVYDASVEDEIKISGWAINTGRYPVKIYWKIDDGEKLPVIKKAKDDIAKEYSSFASLGEEIGYTLRLPTADISNGEHTISLYVKSKTISGLLKEYKFSVKNSHEHSFTKYKYNKDATYISDGTKTAKCDFCNTTKTVTKKGSKLVVGKTSKIVASQTNSSITINWTKVKDATGYLIEMYNSSTGKWDALGYTKNLTYTVNGLARGKVYELTVKAYVDVGKKRVYSESRKKIKTATRPSSVKNLKVTQTSTSVTMSWDKLKGASGYRIYLYDTAKKEWKTVVKKTQDIKFTVKSLKKGTRYTFCVKPYIETDSGIVWAKAGIRIETATKTSTPEIKVVSPSKGAVNVSWTNVGGESGYQVYYSTKKSSDYKKMGTYKANSLKAAKSDLKRGKTYYFKVRAYIKTDSGTVYSSYSPVKSIKIK